MAAKMIEILVEKKEGCPKSQKVRTETNQGKSTTLKMKTPNVTKNRSMGSLPRQTKQSRFIDEILTTANIYFPFLHHFTEGGEA
jgi:hypothetical protein